MGIDFEKQKRDYKKEIKKKRFKINNYILEISFDGLESTNNYDQDYLNKLIAFLQKKILDYFNVFGVLPNPNIGFYFTDKDYKHEGNIKTEYKVDGVEFCIDEITIYSNITTLFINELKR